MNVKTIMIVCYTALFAFYISVLMLRIDRGCLRPFSVVLESSLRFIFFCVERYVKEATGRSFLLINSLNLFYRTMNRGEVSVNM